MIGVLDTLAFWGSWTQATWLEHVSYVLSYVLVIANILIGLREWLRRVALLAEKRNGSARLTAIVMVVMAGWRVLLALIFVYGSRLWLNLPNSTYEDALKLRGLWLSIILVILGKSIFDLWAGTRIHRSHDREFQRSLAQAH